MHNCAHGFQRVNSANSDCLHVRERDGEFEGMEFGSLGPHAVFLGFPGDFAVCLKIRGWVNEARSFIKHSQETITCIHVNTV